MSTLYRWKAWIISLSLLGMAGLAGGETGRLASWNEHPSVVGQLTAIRTPTLNRSGTYQLKLASGDGRSHRVRVRWVETPTFRVQPSETTLYVPQDGAQLLRVAVEVAAPGDYAVAVDLFAAEGTYLGRVVRFLRITERGTFEAPLPFPPDPSRAAGLQGAVRAGRMTAPGEPMRVLGTLTYRDDLVGTDLPIRRAKVELIEPVPVRNFLVDTPIAETRTDAEGRFSFPNVPTVAEDGSPKEYKVRASLENEVLVAMDRFGRTYATETELFAAQPGQIEVRLHLGPQTPGVEANYMVGHLFSTVLDAAEFLEERLGFQRRQIPVEFPTADQATFYQWSSVNGEINVEIIRILAEHAARREPILHEYGHAVMAAVYGYDSTALPRSPFAEPHDFATVSDEAFALQEGWAEWFSALVDDNALNAKAYTNVDLPNIESNAWWTGDLNGNGTNRRGEIVEGAVASVLWDLVDSADSQDTSPGVDDDPISGMLSPLWELFIELRPQTILTIRQAWIDRSLPQLADVLRIFATHGMAVPLRATDVNGDTRVDLLDLVLVATHLGEVGPFGTPGPDVNHDGVVSLVDLVLVARDFGTSSILAAPGGWAALPVQLERDPHTGWQLLLAEPIVALSGLGSGTTAVPQAGDGQWLSWINGRFFWVVLDGRPTRRIALRAPSAARPILPSALEAVTATGQRVRLQVTTLPTPAVTRLLPNFPNPFNPETWIPFQLARPARVRLTLYNAAGQTLRFWDLGRLPAGEYRTQDRAVRWDGTNQLGEPLPSGVYFLVLDADGVRSTRRLLLTK